MKKKGALRKTLLWALARALAAHVDTAQHGRGHGHGRARTRAKRQIGRNDPFWLYARSKRFTIWEIPSPDKSSPNAPRLSPLIHSEKNSIVSQRRTTF